MIGWLLERDTDADTDTDTDTDRVTEILDTDMDTDTDTDMDMEMEMEMDRLSALQDDLLIAILSRLDLKEAARTSVLSKHWRFLWTDLPSLILCGYSYRDILNFIDCVHGALASRRGAALNRLYVSICYNEGWDSDIDVWVELAAKNKVEFFSLILERRVFAVSDYTLPQIMYSNLLLTRLKLEHCIMYPRTTVEWRSMTELSLVFSTLSQQAIEKILSGCPVLRSLELVGCRGFNRLEVGGRSFRSLDLTFHEEGLLEISAPYMLYFNVDMSPIKGTLRLTNVESLHTVSLSLSVDGQDFILEEVMSNAKEIFQNIRHVKRLALTYQSVKVLSLMVMNGWRIPQSTVEYMEMHAENDVRNIYGIIAMLESSPFLETLIISCYHLGKESTNWDTTAQCDLKCDLLHLKTVEIDVFVDSEFSCKSSLALAQILLKRAPVLEKMDICKSTSSSTISNDLIEKFEPLISYPKCSRKALVVISSHD